MDKEHEVILSTAQNAVADTAKAGFEGAKNLAEGAGSVVSDTALVGFEDTKKLAVSANSTVTDTVLALAKKARKTVRAKPVSKKRPALKSARSKTKATVAKPRGTAKRKTAATRARRVARRDWTAQEERTLRKHSKSKTPVKDISKALKRTASALRQKAQALGISLGERRSKKKSASAH